jgi:hypothetical protein
VKITKILQVADMNQGGEAEAEVFRADAARLVTAPE